MIEWRLRTWTTTGTERSPITMNGAISALVRFDVDGTGNCLEAEFVGDPQELSIEARDIIQLQVRETSDDDWISVYKGVVVIPANQRATGLLTYKAVGLKARVYELPLTLDKVDGGDVADMVTQVGEHVWTTGIPTGFTLNTIPPNFGFELGDRFPQLETIGAFLDALAQAVGKFIVPTGETHTYDGVVYEAGDTVPAARWGVDAEGVLFFKRPQRAALEVGEDDAGTLVEWERIVAEEVVDEVVLVYATQNGARNASVRPSAFGSAGFAPAAFRPLSRTFGGGDYEAARVVGIAEQAIDYMTRVTLAEDADAAVDNASNAFDGDTSTYAEITSDPGWVTLAGRVPQGEGYAFDGIAHVRFQATTTTAQRRIDAGNSADVDEPVIEYTLFADEVEEGATVDIYWPILLPLGTGLVEDYVDGGGTINPPVVIFSGVTGDRIYAIEFFIPDEDGSEPLAEAYMRLPEAGASRVLLAGVKGAVSQTMSITPSGGSAIEVPIERIEYRASNDDGLLTTYYLGQRFDPDLMSERAMLEQIADRAAHR